MSVFVKNLAAPSNDQERYFCKHQEAECKDVEQAFGVLKACWQIIELPCKFWYKDMMLQVIKACVILHNMIIEDEQLGNEDYGNMFDYLFEDEDEQVDITPTLQVTKPHDCNLVATTIEELLGAFEAIRCESTHTALRNDLIQHLWTNRLTEHQHYINTL